MDELYSKIIEPKIIEDEFEGKHAVMHMPNI